MSVTLTNNEQKFNIEYGFLHPRLFKVTLLQFTAKNNCLKDTLKQR